jgi:hypothetical protein
MPLAGEAGRYGQGTKSRIVNVVRDLSQATTGALGENASFLKTLTGLSVTTACLDILVDMKMFATERLFDLIPVSFYVKFVAARRTLDLHGFPACRRNTSR